LSSNDTQKRFIQINDDGICEACEYQKRKTVDIDWAFREEQLRALAERIHDEKTSVGNYDIVVPGSGGKDSAFTSHILKYKFGLNPLTVTWAPHLYTEIGLKNFTNWMHVGGLDNILFTPNGKLHRHLTKLSFQNLLHPFQPFIIGQRIIGPRIAAKFGIKHVFYGENQAEYGNAAIENDSPLMQARFYTSQGLHGIKLGGTTIQEIKMSSDFKMHDFLPYLPLTETESSNIQVHYLGYYLRWDPQECFYYASEHTGFQPNDERTEGSYSKYSSIDDKIDPFHYYTTLIKFGLGRASYDAAQEIRNGKISREDGIALVQKYDLEFPHKYFADFLNYIELNSEEFHSTIDRFRPRHLWRQDGNGWQLSRPIWEE
jgi:N-acetyl sugar amidotransferase